jgi:hypothetical protein
LQEELVAGLYREEGETAQKRRIQKKKKKKKKACGVRGLYIIEER